MTRLLPTLVVLFCTALPVWSGHRAPNLPYVQSFPQSSPFYARCIPSENQGNSGTTTIYRVGAQTDEKIDSYNWYSPEGVFLAWSSTDGKVAVMSLREGPASTDDGVEFSFFLGGKHLRSYTARELKVMGVQSGSTSAGRRLSYIVRGVEQMPPNTNESAFVVEINPSANSRKLYFDIRTGNLNAAQ